MFPFSATSSFLLEASSTTNHSFPSTKMRFLTFLKRLKLTKRMISHLGHLSVWIQSPSPLLRKVKQAWRRIDRMLSGEKNRSTSGNGKPKTCQSILLRSLFLSLQFLSPAHLLPRRDVNTRSAQHVQVSLIWLYLLMFAYTLHVSVLLILTKANAFGTFYSAIPSTILPS